MERSRLIDYAQRTHTTMFYIEIRSPKGINGNFKILFLEVDGTAVTVSDKYRSCNISLYVTPAEFKQYEALRKAQEARRQ